MSPRGGLVCPDCRKRRTENTSAWCSLCRRIRQNKNRRIVATPGLMEKICRLADRLGIEAWEDMPNSKLLHAVIDGAMEERK